MRIILGEEILRKIKENELKRELENVRKKREKVFEPFFSAKSPERSGL